MPTAPQTTINTLQKRTTKFFLKNGVGVVDTTSTLVLQTQNAAVAVPTLGPSDPVTGERSVIITSGSSTSLVNITVTVQGQPSVPGLVFPVDVVAAPPGFFEFDAYDPAEPK